MGGISNSDRNKCLKTTAKPPQNYYYYGSETKYQIATYNDQDHFGYLWGITKDYVYMDVFQTLVFYIVIPGH
jgi:hypothetical protein